MTYDEALGYIHSLLKFGIHPGLSRMDSLLNELGNPHNDLRYIHIAGTNGKGSVSTAMSNILIESGLNVGLYTSPYVTDFLERIQYNGRYIEKDIFCDAVNKVKNAVEKLNKDGIVITEFEALTASAFLCFKEKNCDIVVLEVGLGGRLDATNVIKTPLVNIITSLSLDHTAILGDTIEKIAAEKCGTLKPGGTVVVSYNQTDGALKTIKAFAEKNENAIIIPDKDEVEVISHNINGTAFSYKGTKYFVKMPGLHQVVNMTAVIEAAEVLKNKSFNIFRENVIDGISKTVLPARCEIISEAPLIILDGGHNEDGAKAFYEMLSWSVGKKSVYVVGGMMKDKSVEKSLAPLMSLSKAFYAVTPENDRSLKASSLSEIARKYCGEVYSVDSPTNAVSLALSRLKVDDVLCVVGSLYLAGEVRSFLKDECKRRNFS